MDKYTNENTTMSGYRVFETLKCIIKQPSSANDIIHYFEKLDFNENKSISKAVIYKYIATLKYVGINIVRNKCKFEVKNLPFKIDFSKDNLEALSLLISLAQSAPENEISNNINELFYQLNMRYSLDKDFADIYKKVKILLKKPDESQAKIIKKYEKFCKDKLKLHVEYMNNYGEKISLICEPTDVKFENNQILISLYSKNLNEFLELNSKQILKIYQTPSKCAETNNERALTTIYKLKDKLSKRYTLRNNEQIIKKDENELVISNCEEPKDKLHLRLMRYDNKCEICSPKTERGKMLELINKTLSNYGIY